MNASCTFGRAISIAIFASSCLVISCFASGGAAAATGASAETITLHLECEQVKAGRTISEIRLLDGRDRVTELARMFGGQTEAARQHAEALLK